MDRRVNMENREGVEPSTRGLRVRCSTTELPVRSARWVGQDKAEGLGWNDLTFTSEGQSGMEPAEGLEPTTHRLRSDCSTI